MFRKEADFLEGEDLTVYGDGSQTRSFCYVDDQVDGLMKLMNGDNIGPINIGNPTEYTILQVDLLVRFRSGYWLEDNRS